MNLYNSGLALAPQKQVSAVKEEELSNMPGIFGIVVLILGIWAVPKIINKVAPMPNGMDR